MTRNHPLALAHVVEKDGVLTITQSNGSALRNFRNTLGALVGGVVSLLVNYVLFPEAVTSWFRDTPALLLFLCVPFLVMLAQSANRLFGRETFVFDRNADAFIRNGFTVGPLRQIQRVTAQVTAAGQYPMFRLILELPRCETVTIIRTQDIPGNGNFCFSGNVFSDPDKRFAMFTPWLDYEEQRLVPFLPQEITDLRRTILEFVGEACPAPNA